MDCKLEAAVKSARPTRLSQEVHTVVELKRSRSATAWTIPSSLSRAPASKDELRTDAAKLDQMVIVGHVIREMNLCRISTIWIS
jgi:hypothetical protein